VLRNAERRAVAWRAFPLVLSVRNGRGTYSDLEIEVKCYDDVPVRVVTPRTLWLTRKDTVRPLDRLDAAMLAERFGLEQT